MAESKSEDKGQKEAQKKVEKEEEQGYRGVRTDPFDDEAYSLQSGPESPTAREAQAAVTAQEADARKG